MNKKGTWREDKKELLNNTKNFFSSKFTCVLIYL